MKPALTASAVLLSLALAGAACAAEPKAQTPSADIEAQLAAARARLEQAAREVAELSAQLSDDVRDRMYVFTGTPRAVIGLQLDPASGKDGARVLEVSPGGPAAEAGVRKGDVIVAIDGEKLGAEDPARQVVGHMHKVEPNSKVKLGIVRDGGKPQDIEVTARRARGYEFAFRMPGVPAVPPAPPVPPAPGAPPVVVGPMEFGPFGDLNFLRALHDEIAGMELATLTPGLGQYFGTDKGVLVVRAPQSEAFHLHDGDVILAIDGREPKDGAHATRILRSYQPGEKVTLKIMRQKKSVSLEVTMPEPAPRYYRGRETERQRAGEARERARQALQPSTEVRT